MSIKHRYEYVTFSHEVGDHMLEHLPLYFDLPADTKVISVKRFPADKLIGAQVVLESATFPERTKEEIEAGPGIALCQYTRIFLLADGGSIQLGSNKPVPAPKEGEVLYASLIQ
ncbi:MAG TPA: hypothetical protein VHA06_17945 [Candidatus Angelobacter sp.]|jgi:hypothetical protein|nr:hypothetical protein [Candidatus Angelobacter sp.]